MPALLDTIRQAADQTAGPRFFGYIPGGDLFASALANLLGQTLNLSDQTNHCVRKAARIAGFPAAQVRTLPTTAELRIDVVAAAATIAADRAVGLRPFLLVCVTNVERSSM